MLFVWMWSGRCHLAPWSQDDMITSETCHQSSPRGRQLGSGKNKLGPESQTSSITIRLIQPDQAPSSHQRDLRSVLGLILGKFGSSPLLVTPVVISVITMECAACLITLLTALAPEPRISGVYWLCVSPNVYSMLIAFVFKLQLENCIQIQFASNLHQIMDIIW